MSEPAAVQQIGVRCASIGSFPNDHAGVLDMICELPAGHASTHRNGLCVWSSPAGQEEVVPDAVR